MRTPLVSVALVVRDGAGTLPDALTSILQQSIPDWELLVFDDGSTDSTPRIVEELAARESRVRCFRESTSRGLGHRLNQLVAEARGELIARMDADDVTYPQRLEEQAAFLERNPEVDLVGASMVVFKSDGSLWGKREAPAAHEGIAARPYGGFRLFHPTWLGRTSWFRRHPYHPPARKAQDQLLLYEGLRESTYANVPAVLHGYREDRVSVRASVRSRWHLTRHLGASALRRGRPDHALLCAGGHLVRVAGDAVAVATGRHQGMLPHRARPVDAAEEAQWRGVWASVHGA